MHVFLTGGTGYVGGAVLRALLGAGHSVTALVRRDGALAAVTGAARPRELVGDLAAPDGYRAAAAAADAIVHCALQYDEGGAERQAVDERAVAALVEAAGAAGHLVYTASLFEPQARPGEPLPEAGAGELEGWRAEVERAVLDAETAAAVIRLGFVYGGSGGYLPDMLAPGPEGTIRYALPGNARWPFVHVDDLADLYLRVVEARATGVFHAAAGEPVPVAEVARLVGEQVGARPRGLPPEDAEEVLPHVGALMLRDVVPETRRSEELGWQPRHLDFASEVAAVFRDRLDLSRR